MIAIAYLIPLFACLILKLSDTNVDQSVYLTTLFVGEAFVALLHWLFYYLQTHSVEYLGTLVTQIKHEESWVELIKRSVTETDANGRTYTKTEITEQYHPEKFYFKTTRGSTIDTDKDFFRYVISRWKVSPERLWWSGESIKGGKRYGWKASRPGNTYPVIDDTRWVSVTEKHSYCNKIKNSHSIFKYRKIKRKEAKELGLYSYPNVVKHDAPCILTDSFKVDPQIQEKFRRFNGHWGATFQMRLYILIFEAAKGVSMAELQKTYWQGGNKNEFVVCLGVSDEGTVIWSRVFSWADNQELELETSSWFLQNPRLDLNVFHHWFVHKAAEWKRKEFSDFKYILVPLPLWQTVLIYTLSIFENIVVISSMLNR